MDTKEIKNDSTVLWVDRKRQVISFHKVPGFERREFTSHDKLLTFVCTLISFGYSIQ